MTKKILNFSIKLAAVFFCIGFLFFNPALATISAETNISNNSILKGQLILVADGSQKNIEDVKIGDEIISYNPDLKIIEKDKVTEVLKGSHDEYFIFNNTLKTSLDHVVWANNEFRPARDIRVGDFLMDSQGNNVRVFQIDHIYNEVETYDLTIEKNHNFYASNYLVHNALAFYQRHFKIYQDDAGLNSATQYAAEDTNYNVTVGVNFRIRFLIDAVGTIGTIIRRLEFKEDSGDWTQITTNSNNVRLQDSTQFTDADATTTRLTPFGIFIAGQGKDTSSDTSSLTLAEGNYFEDEYSLNFQSAAVGHTYQFRISKAGVALNIYLQTPSVSPLSADSTPPTVSTLSPADGATNVAANSNLVITFSEAVDAETGNINLYKTTGDVLVQAFDVTTDITGTGSDTITINPTSNLDGGTDYYIKIDATAFDDTAGNSYAGIDDTTTWNFTTADITAPTVSEITAVSTPTTDTTPNYTFNSTEAGTITYGGDCSSSTSSAVAGDNTITLTTLSDGTYSNCTIRVTDASNNQSSALSITSFTIDTASPTVSVVNSASSATGATITWTTNESSSSKVDYGTTASYGGSTTESDTSTRVTSHSVLLTGLSSCTTYHYRVRSKDAALNETIDTDNSFITTECGGGGLPAVAYFLPAPPAGGFKILINPSPVGSGPSASTSSSDVTLSLTAGNDIKNMAISNSPDFQGSWQEPYQPTKQWNLCYHKTACPAGEYTVYARFFTQYGQSSEIVKDTILYKTTTGAATKTGINISQQQKTILIAQIKQQLVLLITELIQMLTLQVGQMRG